MTKRPTLVLLHGHPVSPVIWDLLTTSLDHDYTIVKPDFSRLIDHTTVDAYADELYGQLSSSDVGGCVLIGHSMGGYIALAMAEKYPDRVKGLVLFHSTAFADPDTDEQRQKRQDAQTMLETEGGHAYVAKAIPAAFAEENRQALADTVTQLVETHKNLPTEAMLSALQAIRSRPDRLTVLENAPFPVLIIAGRQDPLIPFEQSEKLSQQLPQAELVVLEQSGHMGMLEEPEKAVLALRPFVDKIKVD